MTALGGRTGSYCAPRKVLATIEYRFFYARVRADAEFAASGPR